MERETKPKNKEINVDLERETEKNKESEADLEKYTEQTNYEEIEVNLWWHMSSCSFQRSRHQNLKKASESIRKPTNEPLSKRGLP